MNSHKLLNKLAALKLSRDQGRVLLTLVERGKTIKEIRGENPRLSVEAITNMHNSYLKRQKVSKAYIYRLTERGLNAARLLFDEETAPQVNHAPDSPPLPFENAHVDAPAHE